MMNKFLKFWAPVLVWMGMIFLFSSIPSLKSGLEEDFILRKIAHVLEFAILTFLLLRAFQPTVDQPTKVVGLAIVFSLFYSLSDEYHQTFVFGREGALKDVGIDSIGIFLMGLIWYIKKSGRK